MRINHSSLADVSAHVYKHRRHADDAAPDISRVANAGSAGNDSNAVAGRDRSNGIRGLVDERLACRVDGHVHDRAHAEAQENSLLHPGVCPPAGFSAFGRTRGRRHTGSSKPISAIAAFTGMGLDSTKFISISGWKRRWTSRAPAKSFRRASLVRRTISAGISFETTEMTPRPPRAMSGSVMASSPERTMNSSGTALRIAAICEMLPEASLMPAMFSILASRFTVAGSMFTPVRPCTL